MESVKVPRDLTARIQPRLSTCLIGLSLQTADIDAGYEGGLRFSAHCINQCSVDVGTRFAQVIFQQLSAPTEKPYEGTYQKTKGLEFAPKPSE